MPHPSAASRHENARPRSPASTREPVGGGGRRERADERRAEAVDEARRHPSPRRATPPSAIDLARAPRTPPRRPARRASARRRRATGRPRAATARRTRPPRRRPRRGRAPSSAPAHVHAPLGQAGRRGEVGDRRLVALLRRRSPRRAGRRRTPPTARESGVQTVGAHRRRRPAARTPRGRSSSRRRPTSSFGTAKPERRRAGDHADPIAERRDLAPGAAASECVGTTTASACFTARFSIARCQRDRGARQLVGRLPRPQIPDA